jgi:hypothetical protein
MSLTWNASNIRKTVLHHIGASLTLSIKGPCKTMNVITLTIVAVLLSACETASVEETPMCSLP